ncbi:MAG: electron transport complex subunit E [Clostridia bacterium]|jgi:electron transport complex protein RnfE|nr:electron transport complex subunit E [Clostridia bacterium]MBQ9342826.1 electron transport complex subunit E [Clostridia bacterium]MBR6300657.1 electron transport complex subunit E [Clostridia bacterium]
MSEKRQNLGKVVFNGILTENPTFRLVLGTCPTLAVTTSAINGLGMGAAATFVLLGSNVVISALRKFIPDKVRIPSFIVIICMFVTMVQLLMQAYLPSLYESLGIFLPLIVVNCIILGRAEAFASKNPVAASAADGLGMGIGFTLALTLMGCIRELLGNGTVFGASLLGTSYQPMLLMILPAGGFLVYGLMLGIINALSNRGKEDAK